MTRQQLIRILLIINDIGQRLVYLIRLATIKPHPASFIPSEHSYLILWTHRREHITPVLFALHWLPIRQRIQFKLLLLVYRCTHQLAPDYLTDLVVPYVPARSLRSADLNLLTVKLYNLERYGRRSFSVAGPSLWNALPSAIRNSVSLPAFRSSLKTHLFREAFVTLM